MLDGLFARVAVPVEDGGLLVGGVTTAPVVEEGELGDGGGLDEVFEDVLVAAKEVGGGEGGLAPELEERVALGEGEETGVVGGGARRIEDFRDDAEEVLFLKEDEEGGKRFEDLAVEIEPEGFLEGGVKAGKGFLKPGVSRGPKGVSCGSFPGGCEGRIDLMFFFSKEDGGYFLDLDVFGAAPGFSGRGDPKVDEADRMRVMFMVILPPPRKEPFLRNVGGDQDPFIRLLFQLPHISRLFYLILVKNCNPFSVPIRPSCSSV